MKIEDYSFGKMRVEGKEYTNDIIIFPDRVLPDWWRDEGHSLSIPDLEEVLKYAPQVLVVGTGAQGVMNIPEDTKEELRNKGIELLSGPTGDMWKRFNNCLEEGKKCAGAFHLTC